MSVADVKWGKIRITVKTDAGIINRLKRRGKSMKEIRPDHYKETSIECFDALKIILGKRGFAAFCFGNVFKYLWRHEAKNGQEDVDKAGTYLMQLNDMKKHGELAKSDERKLESLMELYRKESEKYAQS